MELLVGRLLQARGGLEVDFCHTVGNMDTQERGCLQGHLPIRRCHFAHSRGVLFFLAPRWRRPLKLCTPTVIDLVVTLFHCLNGNWGHRLGCFPPSHKKKKNESSSSLESCLHIISQMYFTDLQDINPLLFSNFMGVKHSGQDHIFFINPLSTGTLCRLGRNLC